jgi:hypothetical protein
MKYIEGLTIFNSLAILVIVILMIMYKVDNVKETFSDGTNLIVAEDDAGNLVTVSKTELEKLIDDRAQAKIDKIPPAGLDIAGVNSAIDARVTAAYINGKLPRDIIRNMEPVNIISTQPTSNGSFPTDNKTRILGVDANSGDNERNAQFVGMDRLQSNWGDGVNIGINSQLFITKTKLGDWSTISVGSAPSGWSKGLLTEATRTPGNNILRGNDATSRNRLMWSMWGSAINGLNARRLQRNDKSVSFTDIISREERVFS